MRGRFLFGQARSRGRVAFGRPLLFLPFLFLFLFGRLFLVRLFLIIGFVVSQFLPDGPLLRSLRLRPGRDNP
jgi:hypothetical protein